MSVNLGDPLRLFEPVSPNQSPDHNKNVQISDEPTVITSLFIMSTMNRSRLENSLNVIQCQDNVPTAEAI